MCVVHLCKAVLSDLTPSSVAHPERMTADERRSAFSLASIYALRMLGLFMVMPVFMLEARHYEGGADISSVGLAMGVYGLVQAVLQIPFGMAADRIGRKRVIYMGLALLAPVNIERGRARALAPR